MVGQAWGLWKMSRIGGKAEKSSCSGLYSQRCCDTANWDSRETSLVIHCLYCIPSIGFFIPSPPRRSPLCLLDVLLRIVQAGFWFTATSKQHHPDILFYVIHRIKEEHARQSDRYGCCLSAGVAVEREDEK